MHWLWLFLIVLTANVAAQVLAVLIFKPQMFKRRKPAQSETPAEAPIRPATGWYGGLAVGADRDAMRNKQQFRRPPNG